MDFLSNSTMNRFYPSFESINALTLSLDYHRNELECAHCFKNDQFVSHGVIYKQRSSLLTDKVGKRIFCSNRYGRSGCGRTFQLYVASEVPHFRYGAAQLFIFIVALITRQNIGEAYSLATGQDETRNGWRWLTKMMLKLSDYRSFLRVRRISKIIHVYSKNNHLQHLLPTLLRLFNATSNGCFNYQMKQQRAFF